MRKKERFETLCSATTVLNGAMPDENAWRRDIDSVVKFVTTSAAKQTAAR